MQQISKVPVTSPLPVRGLTAWPTPVPSAGFRESNGPGTANQAPLDALLHLVATGNVLFAKLLELSSCLPPALQGDISRGKYTAVLPDFSYFKDPEAMEKAVEASPQLVALDDEFREAHEALLGELYDLYRGIVELHGSFTDFLQQLKEGDFLQCSLETVMMRQRGRQLLLEAVHISGALLLALDASLPGSLRERTVVAHFRVRGGARAVGPSVNAVIMLCADTGLRPASASAFPKGYPCNYFGRLALPSEVVMAVIACVRSDDVYNQVTHYPSPDHRTTALAHQAAGLYIALYYVPNVLHKDTAIMRALVDRHFCDCWVISWAPGFRADLAMEWEGFRAARNALGTVATATRARDMAAAFTSAAPGLRSQLAAYLVEGQLREEYVLQRAGEVFGLLRQCGVALRWLLLHTAGRQKRLRAAVVGAAPPLDQLLGLLLHTALLEYEVKRVYTALLNSKDERWDEQKRALSSSVADMAAFFQALRALPRASVPPDMPDWFAGLLQQVDGMDIGDPGATSARVQALLMALDDCERFHPVEAGLQTRAYLGAIRGHLARLLRVADVRPEQMATLAAISDFAYGWGIMDSYTPRIQAMVRAEPATVVQLRALFVKLRSLLELPLLRLGQARHPALPAVSALYSSSLRAYARHVLQVVPTIVWEVVDECVVKRTRRMAPVAGRLPLEQLRAAAQLGPRARLAHLTARAAAYAAGIHALQQTLMGVAEIAPKQLLEDGIRKGLAHRIAGMCSNALSFPFPAQPLAPPPVGALPRQGLAAAFAFPSSFSSGIAGREELRARLADLGTKLSGFRDAFEDMQDFIDVQGLRIWMEEYQRVVAASVGEEARVFAPQPSENPLRASPGGPPLPSSSVAPEPHTFVGRLLSELLRVTDPQRTQYQPLNLAWTDGSGAETLGPQTLRLLQQSLGAHGLTALDRLLGFRLQLALTGVVRYCRTELDAGTQAALREVAENAGSCAPNQDGAPLVYTDAQRRAGKTLALLIPALALVGQARLLRQRLTAEIADSCRFESSGLLADALSAVNMAFLADACSSQADLEGEGNTGDRLAAPQQLLDLVKAAGLEEAGEKLYIHVAPLPQLPELLLLLVLSVVGQYKFNRQLALLERGPKSGKLTVDSVALACGIVTLLQHFDLSYTEAFLDAVGQCIRAYAQMATSAVARGVQAAGIDVTLPAEVGALAAFTEELGRQGAIPRDLMHQHVPPLILDLWLSIAE